jgi:hypothetical protein
MAVSVGKEDITPAAAMLMAGYGVSSPRLATGTYMPLWARCTVLWDNGYPNVIVTVDVLGFGRGVHQAIRAQVEALGVARSDFVLTATHTHNGPVLTGPINPYILYNTNNAQMSQIQTYTDELVADIVTLVATTLASSRTACTLDYRVVDENFSYNREGLPYVERDVPMLVARSLAGTPLAVLFGYGCHPVAAGGQSLFDPDYPGEAVSWIEDLTGCFAQFLLGPAGDQNPTTLGTWAARDALGSDLGHTVINALNVPGRPITGPITTTFRDITLPLDVTDTPSNLAAARINYTTRMNNTGLTSYIGRHAKTMIDQIDTHSFATTVPLPLQAWKLTGSPPLRLVFSGGEIVSGYGVYYRARYGGSNGIWVSGYANETPAYIPSDELLYTHPGIYYACGWSPDYPGMAGGSMTAYGWIGHFRGRPPGTSTAGVEQIMLSQITAML